MAQVPLPAAKQAPLEKDHFRGDRSHRIEEAHLREILAAPVFIEEGARVGVVPVNDVYSPDDVVPLAPALAELERALDRSAAFQVVTEISTAWPNATGIAGLRELAARYRSEYLLLYRHRFVDDTSANAWAFLYPTVVAAFFVPANTIRTAGILEATLFDVKSGTILFTTFERIAGNEEVNVWQNERKKRALQHRLVEEAAERLGREVEQEVAYLERARKAHRTAHASGRGVEAPVVLDEPVHVHAVESTVPVRGDEVGRAAESKLEVLAEPAE